MARIAVISGGIVENVIEADDGFTIPGKSTVPAGDAGPGWLYENGVFTPPPIDQRAVIFSKIQALEAEQTPRRQREAILSGEGQAWLENLESEISALREQLAGL